MVGHSTLCEEHISCTATGRACILDSEDRIDKRSYNRALSEHQKCAHQDDRDDQRRQPVFLADLKKVPNIFKEVEKGCH